MKIEAITALINQSAAQAKEMASRTKLSQEDFDTQTFKGLMRSYDDMMENVRSSRMDRDNDIAVAGQFINIAISAILLAEQVTDDLGMSLTCPRAVIIPDNVASPPPAPAVPTSD